MPASYFSNATVIITGAASGIGQQLAVQAAQKGAWVIATDSKEEGLMQTKAMAGGAVIETQVLDVANAEAVSEFANRVIPTLDNKKLVLINNAGVALLSGSFDQTFLQDFEWLLNINLWGTIRMTKAFYPYLLQQNSGYIVNLSSVFGLGGFAMQSAYCTSKFGIRGFTETLRMELSDTGVRTLCVHPGGVRTNIVKNAPLKNTSITADMHQKSITQFAGLAKTTPQKAAQLILNAVDRGKQRLVIGKDGRAIDFITRFLPVRYTRIAKKKMEKEFPGPNISTKQ